MDKTFSEIKRDLGYYEARVAFLKTLLMGHLSGKQRAQAERELMQANIRRIRVEKEFIGL